VKYPLASIAIAFLFIGCSDSLSPDQSIVTGRFGSTGNDYAELVSLRGASRLDLSCAWVDSEEPLHLGDDGQFIIVGQYGSTQLVITPRPVFATIRGTVVADTLVLTLKVQGQSTTLGPYRLVRNVTAVNSAVCAQAGDQKRPVL
jgi:hypothetical protein